MAALLPEDLLDQGGLRHMHGEDGSEARLPHRPVPPQPLQLADEPGEEQIQ